MLDQEQNKRSGMRKLQRQSSRQLQRLYSPEAATRENVSRVKRKKSESNEYPKDATNKQYQRETKHFILSSSK